MKLKLFFILMLIGLSLQAQTQELDTSDELDVIDELDINPDVPAAVVPAKTAVVETATPTPTIIPRVYQTLMPLKKQHTVTPSIAAVGVSAIDKQNKDIKYMNSSVQTRISYEYGLTNNQAVGADLSYLSHINRISFLSTELSQKFNSLGNPSVHYKNLFNLSGISFMSFVEYSFKLETETMDTDKQEGNSAKGQNKVSLGFGGYKALNSDTILGGFVHYTNALDGEKIVKSGSGRETIKLSKGDRMVTTIFMEIQNEWRPNIALSFSKNFSIESTDQFDTKTYSFNIDFIDISASGQFQTGKDIFFIPEVSYSMALNNDHLDKYSIFSFYGGIRLLY